MNDTQNFGPENNSPVTQKRDPKESIKMPASWEIYEARQGGILPRRTPFDRKFLAVLVPHTGEVPAEFSHRLAYLRMPPNSEIFMSKEIPLDVSRENMARRALDAGFEWLFFLDSDVLPPENVFEELFSVKQHLPDKEKMKRMVHLERRKEYSWPGHARSRRKLVRKNHNLRYHGIRMHSHSSPGI